MINSRKFTLNLLVKLKENDSYSNILLDSAIKDSKLDDRDKRFVTKLFYGVIERQITLDAVISNYSKKPIDKMPIEVIVALRIAIYQLLYMDSVPDSAAVNESVNLVKLGKCAGLKGFVNGVLRSFLRDEKKLPEFKSEIKNLSVKYSCPEWLINKWIKEYGKDFAKSMLETSIQNPPIMAKLNTTKKSLEDILKELDSEGIEYKLNQNFKDSVELIGAGAIEKTKVYKQGLLHIQDLSSQFCCKVLDPRPGETVIDICASPGGKTFTMAELMQNFGEIISCDLYESRVKLIEKGAKRLSLDIVKPIVNDGTKYNKNIKKADKVLCDVLCSGLGVIRRKPEIKYKDKDSFNEIIKTQRDILKTTAEYLKVGGILVYSTCTTSKEENEDNISWFLKENNKFVLDTIENYDKCGMITISPEMFNSDGFFIAKLKRVK